MQVTSLVALIKKRLGIDAVCTPGGHGQFDVMADGERIATRGGNWLTRRFGAGYPDFNNVVEKISQKRAQG